MAVRRGVRFRADDIWDTPDDGDRYEVIDGRLYVSPPPILVHQNASGVLYFYLVQHVRQWRLGGKVYAAPVGVVLDDENGLQPDLVYVSRERAGILAERGIEGAPDLVVEILSPSTRGRDRGIKMRRYAAAGVSYYWVVDPRTRTLEEYLLVEQGYELVGHVSRASPLAHSWSASMTMATREASDPLVGSHGPGSIFRPALFPGLEIPIDDLWA